MKTSEAFALVKNEIKKEKNHYICTTIWALYALNKIPAKQKHKCLNIIKKSLNYLPTYEVWLRHNHETFYNTTLKSKGIYYIKQGRIQWLDALIVYYKKQGD